MLSRCLGRDVRVEEIPLESWSTQAVASGLGRYQVSTLVAMFRYYARYGFCGNARVLTWLLGRSPTDLATFVSRAAAGR